MKMLRDEQLRFMFHGTSCSTSRRGSGRTTASTSRGPRTSYILLWFSEESCPFQFFTMFICSRYMMFDKILVGCTVRAMDACVWFYLKEKVSKFHSRFRTSTNEMIVGNFN
eukprot:360970_1